MHTNSEQIWKSSRRHVSRLCAYDTSVRTSRRVSVVYHLKEWELRFEVAAFYLRKIYETARKKHEKPRYAAHVGTINWPNQQKNVPCSVFYIAVAWLKRLKWKMRKSLTKRLISNTKWTQGKTTTTAYLGCWTIIAAALQNSRSGAVHFVRGGKM